MAAPPPPARATAKARERQQVAPPPATPAPEPAPPPQELHEQAPLLDEATAPQACPAQSRDAERSDLSAAAGAAATEEASRSNAPANALGFSKRVALPPWEADAQLDPDAWIERIRERVQSGDRLGAQNSLRRYQLNHPNRRIPEELHRLLVE
jgi:hypothetical protein